MNATRLLIVAMLAIATTTAAAIELRGVRRNRTRPCLSSGIPIANYQSEKRSASVFAISKTPLPEDNPLERFSVTTEGDAVVSEVTAKSVISGFRSQNEEVIRTEESIVGIENALPFPLAATDEFTSREIKLFQWSQTKLAIDHCFVSQPALLLSRNGDWVLSLRADQNPKSPTNAYNPTLYIKRNKFVIHLRCYGNFETLPTKTGAKVGRPILAELPVNEFWVENGQPKFVRLSGNSKTAGQYFELIDRVEFEFYYLK